MITGKKGENIAVSFLKKKGFQILDTNFRCMFGEIDIIALENGEYVFIEVKTRKSEERGYPEQAVGITKQRKISRVALYYLQANNLLDVKARFDVVAVIMSGLKNEVTLIKDAFDLSVS
jgi:putative endonuclease